MCQGRGILTHIARRGAVTDSLLPRNVSLSHHESVVEDPWTVSGGVLTGEFIYGTPKR